MSHICNLGLDLFRLCSVILKDAMSVFSAPSSRPSRVNIQDECVVLSVHGIAEPGPEIKSDLVQVLQNRLDEAVLDVITAMFVRNPMHKLTADDVQVRRLKNYYDQVVLGLGAGSKTYSALHLRKCK